MDKSSLIITRNSQIQKTQNFVFAGKGMIMQIPLQSAPWMDLFSQQVGYKIDNVKSSK